MVTIKYSTNDTQNTAMIVSFVGIIDSEILLFLSNQRNIFVDSEMCDDLLVEVKRKW